MTPEQVLHVCIEPALEFLADHGIRPSDEARQMLLTIAGQEGDWRHRRQIGGPARSIWQGEKGGGMILAVHHAVTAKAARALLEAHDIGEPDLGPWKMPTDTTIYEAMAWHDVVAAGLARLLLYTDPRALPKIGQVQYAWDYYDSVWRPGKPHPETWPSCYEKAQQAIIAWGHVA